MIFDKEAPKHQKRAEKSKPWIVEARISPEYRKGQSMPLSRDWFTWGRYKTEEKANQAMDDKVKGNNHGWRDQLVFEYRVRKAN